MCVFLCAIGHGMTVKLGQLFEIYLSFPAMDWLEAIIRHIRRNETMIQPPSLSSKRKRQINQHERRELFCSKCHLAVAESPEDQTGSPQASAGGDSSAHFSLFPPTPWASVHTHIRTRFLLIWNVNQYRLSLSGRRRNVYFDQQSLWTPNSSQTSEEHCCHDGWLELLSVALGREEKVQFRDHAAIESFLTATRRPEALTSEIWLPAFLNCESRSVANAKMYKIKIKAASCIHPGVGFLSNQFWSLKLR